MMLVSQPGARTIQKVVEGPDRVLRIVDIIGAPTDTSWLTVLLLCDGNVVLCPGPCLGVGVPVWQQLGNGVACSQHLELSLPALSKQYRVKHQINLTYNTFSREH